LPILLLGIAVIGGAAEIDNSVTGTEAATIFIRAAQTIPVSHEGPQNAVQALDSGAARPVSLARGDFDENGIEDLVAGYAMPDGSGIAVLHRGNLDAFAPQSNDSWLAIAEKRYVSPFLSPATVFQVPKPPDFMATGNFEGNDHIDVVTASRGDNVLYLLVGDGHGNLAPPQAIPLPGPVSLMTAGRFGAGNLPSKVIVGIGGSTPAVLVYSASAQSWSIVSEFPLSSPATSFALDDMDGDGRPDVVIVAGGQISILHAVWSASGQPGLEALSIPNSAVTVSTGFFVHDRGWRRQIAVLDQTGAVSIVVHGGFDSRGWTKEEVKAMRDAMLNRRPNPFRRKESGPVGDGWKVIERLPGMASYSETGPAAMLLTSRISGNVTDDVFVIDSESGRMAVSVHPPVNHTMAAFASARLSTRVYAGGIPVTALSFPVNADAREGLVVLHKDDAALWVMMPVSKGESVVASQPLQETK
jgi:hypothetical protein